MQVDIAAIVQQAIQPLQQDIHTSMPRLDSCYDELSHTVELLHQQCQQKFQQYKQALPSLAKHRDGHA